MKKNLLFILFTILPSLVFSQIDTISTNIYQKDGSLGVGTNNPNSLFSIKNTPSFMGYATNTAFSSYTKIYDNSTATFNIYGYPNTNDLPEYLKGSIMLYSTDDARNFKICAAPREGNIQFLTDGWIDESSEKMRITAKGYVGIGTSSPSSLLKLESNVSSGVERNLLQINNLAESSLAYTGILLKTGNDGYESVIQDYSINYTGSAHYDFGGFLNISNNSKGLIFHANSPDAIMKFYTGHDEIAGAGIERMRIDANGNIGINQINPSRTLDINGSMKLEPQNYQLESPAEGDIYMDSNDHILKYYNGSEWIFVDDTIQRYDSIFVYDTIFRYDTVYVISEPNNTTEEIWSKNDSSVFYENGYVGIGTTKPNSRLQITDGDIYIENIENGIIMKSPNGQCWRGVLDDSGNLTFSQIDCPESSISITNQFVLNGEVSVYPNPSNKTIAVNFDSSINKKINYEIFDTNGVKHKEGKIRRNKEELDISTFAAGLYIINFNDKSGNLIASKKIIKK